MDIRYTDRSKIDVSIAFNGYEKQKNGLGYDFLISIEDSIEKIIRNPKLYPVSHSNFHRCIIRRFPFSIYYSIEEEFIIIHSVFNNRLHPSKMPK